jgi:sugar lactone lactonase YvrE
MVPLGQVITSVAGRGSGGSSGDEMPASEAYLSYPNGIVVGPDGSIYIADSANHRIRRVNADNIITTVAGNGIAGFSGDGNRNCRTIKLSHRRRLWAGWQSLHR